MKVTAHKTINMTQSQLLKKTIIRLLMGSTGLGKTEILQRMMSNPGLEDYWNNDCNAPRYMYRICGKAWTIGGSSCGGHFHFLAIYDELIYVSHEGARSSCPGNAMDLIFEYKDSGIFDSAEWKLEKYETSQPEWAPVAGFLFGKFGQDDKPANAFEADLFKAQKIMMLAKKIVSVTDISLPKVKESEYFSPIEQAEKILNRIKKSLDGVHYRRLAALGMHNI